MTELTGQSQRFKNNLVNKVLVTGGAGFIGSHVCQALLRLGVAVVVIDNFCDFYDPAIKRINIKEIIAQNKKHSENFSIFEGDIRDIEFINSVLESHSPEAVIHLAAYAGVRPSIQNPVLYNEVNVMGTINLLEAMKINQIKNLIFASSSSVYGTNDKVPFSEADFVDHPISPYAATKRTGELICHTYSHLYHMHIACLRFFTVYGPRQRPDLAIHKFTKYIFENKPIPFYGDGDTKRDYTYIDDIVAGVLGALKWVQKEHALFDIFNLGESRTISLLEMVKTIELEIGKEALLEKLPLQPGDVPITYANIDKAVEQLGYNPKTNFSEGIRRFVNWYKRMI